MTIREDGFRPIVLALAGAALALFCGAGALQAGTAAFLPLCQAMGVMAGLTLGFVVWARVRRVSFEVVTDVRAVHWGQFCVQLSIIAALGYHSKAVMDYAPLVACQLFFAMLLQILLAGFFRRRFEFSFSVFPIVGSINLFIWFYPQFFVCQLLMVGFAVVAKFFFRRGGRHIFNPSGLAMAVAVYAVLLFYAAGSREMLSPALLFAYNGAPDAMLVWVFLVSCVSLYIAGRFAVALGGVAVMAAAFFGGKLLFGLPLIIYVVHPNVFVGFTLLITDPATSPRKVLGQLLYGAGYGVSVLAGFALLAWFDFSTFYDKILFLPLLNAAVPLFEKLRRVDWLESPLGRRTVVALHGGLFLLAVMPFRSYMGCLACFGKAALPLVK